jgi:hypothetical protein
MQTTRARDFPRLYELYCDSNTAINTNFLANFEDVVNYANRQRYFKELEKDLQQLDDKAWQELKRKALKYVIKKDKLRGWEQLFNTLSEVKGYLYLKAVGCTEVYFIPERNTSTPDLYGRCGSDGILMEVKTINRSDEELKWIEGNLKEYLNWKKGKPQRLRTREYRTGLDNHLECKIIDTINTAKNQLLSYDCNRVRRKIVYLVVDLDILFTHNSRNLDEFAAYIDEQSEEQIEVKYCFSDW